MLLRPLRFLLPVALTVAACASEGEGEPTPAPTPTGFGATDGTPGSSDPIVAGTRYDTAGIARTGGALTATSSGLASCDGDALIQGIGRTELGATCLTVAAHESRLVVATDDGRWHEVNGAALSASVEAPAPLGLALSEDRVYGAMGTDGVLSAPASLSSAPTPLPGARDARAVLVTESGDLLVADGADGVALIAADGSGELARLDAPLKWAFSSSLSWLAPGRAVVGVAGFGLLVVDVEQQTLSKVGALGTLGFVMDVAVSGAHVATAEWTALRVFDLSDPAAPTLVARQDIPDRAVSVAAAGDAFFVAGSGHVTAFHVNPAVSSPALRIERRSRKIEVTENFGGVGSVGLLIYNDGNEDLVIEDLAMDDPTFSFVPADLNTLTVGPEGVEFIEISIDGTESRTATLTFSTNDPDYAADEFLLHVNPTPVALGDMAPDFVSPTTRGDVVALSDFRGSVSHIKLFSAL